MWLAGKRAARARAVIDSGTEDQDGPLLNCVMPEIIFFERDEKEREKDLRIEAQFAKPTVEVGECPFAVKPLLDLEAHDRHPFHSITLTLSSRHMRGTYPIP